MVNYIYTPQSDYFKCRVPLRETLQAFVVDGTLQQEGSTGLKKGKSGKGYEISFGKEAQSGKILQIISIRSHNTDGTLEYGNSISVEENSEASLLLCSHTFTMNGFQTKEKLDINISQCGRLNLVIMQNEHDRSHHNTSINIEIGRDAICKLHLVTLHGGKIDNKINISLNDKGGECNLHGLYLAGGNQEISNCVNIYHNAGECKSNQLFKGILDGNAVTRFSGTIYVEKDAQKTEAYQANNNLLSSDNATAYTKPHLEIYADDVKCSHGATVGSLDEDELFYMRSRGISLEEAKLLQQQAFANATIEDLANPELRERLTSLIESRLRGEFSECQNCDRHCC